ncbi:MAG: ATP-binding cassette domain-containing protein [Planctomycetota bacterium]
MNTLRLQHRVTTAAEPTPRVGELAAMFGLGLDAERTVDIVPPIELELTVGRVVFLTGPSGSGKSTVLRLIAEQLRTERVIDIDRVVVPDGSTLTELWDDPLADVLRRLSVVGLADAFMMLRRPEQLSDGQRFRLRLATALREAERMSVAAERDDNAFPVLLADEFCATLDRATARVISQGLAKWARASGVAIVVATTHDDLLEPLNPDALVAQQLGGAIEVLTR